MAVDWTKKPLRRTLKTVYDDIDNAFESQAIGDNSITNAKLGTDIKVGSLESLNTSETSSLVGAINEVDTNADSKYTKPGSGIPSTDMTTEVQASLALANSALQNISGEEATPVNAVASQGTLSISGVVIDGETVTIDGDVYEFLADAAQSKTSAGNIAVDITSHTTASTGTFTVTVQPTSGEDFTIGSTTYTFVPVGTGNAAGEVEVGANLAGAQENIVAAINGTDGVNSANASASAAAFDTNASTITALVGGTAGDSIATTENMANGSFGAGTLGSGADCTAANADGALIGADEGSTYSMAQGTGETVVVTAATKGTAGDSIETTEDMANGEFGQGTLGDTTAGVDGTVGAKGAVKFDSSYLYVCVDTNTIADDNWRRISLGSAY